MILSFLYIRPRVLRLMIITLKNSFYLSLNKSISLRLSSYDPTLLNCIHIYASNLIYPITNLLAPIMRGIKSSVLNNLEKAIFCHQLRKSSQFNYSQTFSITRQQKINNQHHEPRASSLQSFIIQRKQTIQKSRWKRLPKQLRSIEQKIGDSNHEYFHQMLSKNKDSKVYYRQSLDAICNYNKKQRRGQYGPMFRNNKITKALDHKKQWNVDESRAIAYRIKPYWKKMKTISSS